ncbi:hypothetical protein [Chitinophaga silvatica]|nr:hypothetical protein [Chitinophaga silvatica]
MTRVIIISPENKKAIAFLEKIRAHKQELKKKMRESPLLQNLRNKVSNK